MTEGVTLLEVLLAIAALGILAGIAMIVINPTRQQGETRNADRKVDVNTILNAVYQYTIDNGGTLPASITTTSTEICATGGTCSELIDLSVLTNEAKYLTTIPLEPKKKNENGAGYMIKKSDDQRITIDAQFEEQGEIISITR